MVRLPPRARPQSLCRADRRVVLVLQVVRGVVFRHRSLQVAIGIILSVARTGPERVASRSDVGKVDFQPCILLCEVRPCACTAPAAAYAPPRIASLGARTHPVLKRGVQSYCVRRRSTTKLGLGAAAAASAAVIKSSQVKSSQAAAAAGPSLARSLARCSLARSLAR